MVISLIITLILFYQHQRNFLPPAPKAPSRSSGKSSATARPWETFTNCRLLPASSNDGDSFLVQHGEQQHTFRLYFVDCPEKNYRGLSAQRLTDQAHYFDLPSPQAASAVGQAAAEFTYDLLQRPFTIITKWERVYDSQRFYAQALVRNSENLERDLAELLIERGYARIFTKGTHLLGQASEASFTQHLRTLETASKAARSGAWAH